MNQAEATELIRDSRWPSGGTLTFFHDPSSWGFDPLVRDHCRVHFTRPGENLVQVAPPGSLPDDAKFPKRMLHFKPEWTLPQRVKSVESHAQGFSIWDNDEYCDLRDRLMDDPVEGGVIHRCGGNAQEIHDDMRLECQLVTNGIYCGDSTGYQDSRRKVLEKGAADWQLLLQIDSDEKRLGWMWGDVGRIYFWLRKLDIASGDFDQAWAILQCY